MSGNGLDYAEVSQLSRRLRYTQKRAPEKLDEWLHNKIGPELKAAMIAEAPKRTEALARSITQVNGPGEVSVGTQGIGYVKFVIEGTRAHEIRPRTAGALSFTIGGKKVFATVVHHPGTRPNNFMDRAAKQVLKKNFSLLSGLKFGLEKHG